MVSQSRPQQSTGEPNPEPRLCARPGVIAQSEEAKDSGERLFHGLVLDWNESFIPSTCIGRNRVSRPKTRSFMDTIGNNRHNVHKDRNTHRVRGWGQTLSESHRRHYQDTRRISPPPSSCIYTKDPALMLCCSKEAAFTQVDQSFGFKLKMIYDIDRICRQANLFSMSSLVMLHTQEPGRTSLSNTHSFSL